MERNKHVKINISGGPKLILLTEMENQRIIVKTPKREGLNRNIISIFTIKHTGRYEFCLCSYHAETIWLTNIGDLIVIPGGGLMSTFVSKTTGHKLMIKYNGRLPSLQYLCHLHINASQENRMHKFSKTFRISTMLQGKQKLPVCVDKHFIFPPCKCFSRKSLPDKISNFFQTLKSGSRKFFLFLFFLFIFL
jgi:hypothetical protein